MATMTVKEAAQALGGVSEQYVRRLLGDGLVSGARHGKSWTVDTVSLSQFMARRGPGPHATVASRVAHPVMAIATPVRTDAEADLGALSHEALQGEIRRLRAVVRVQDEMLERARVGLIEVLAG